MAKHRKSTRKTRKPESAGVALKLKALRKLAKSHGLKVGGKKGSLIARLRRSGALSKAAKKSGKKSRKSGKKSRKCRFGVNKVTGKCLKHKRSKSGKKSSRKSTKKSRKSTKKSRKSRKCRYGVSKRKSANGKRKCLKSPRRA